MTQYTTLRIYLLGPMRIEQDAVPIHFPRRKVESLLAFLLLHPEQHNRDQLATLFWGDSTDAQARHSLRTAISTVRQLVSADLLLTDRDHVQLNPNFPLWTDLDELFDLENEFDYTNRDLLHARLALWQGELLAGFYDEWITVEREHYGTRLIKLFLQVTQNLRAASEYEQAIAVAQRLLTIDPANEYAHQHLMFCYVASGDRPAALRQYELCERALADELDASPLPETVALYHWIKQYDGDGASSAAKITNLPIPLSSFVGRTRETAEIKRLLTVSLRQNGKNGSDKKGTVRLLTLMGAGGSGKTRLAIQTATDLIDSFDHGVWWVELAALGDGALVARAVAKVLGVRETAEVSVIQSVANFVGDKQMLVVIDNCEHLIEPCAQLASALLERCPNLQILATSREALNITGEMLWHVPTFAVPDPAKLTLVDLLINFESLRLFSERAAAVQPGFTLTADNAKAVVEICQRLDGIPLAIELAAARVKLLSVEQIATYLTRELGARFELLTQGSRAAMPRHQTLRATIDWSYALLDEAERLLFRQVAVFRGGFTLELLQKVVAANRQGNQRAGASILDLLAQLVDKSLVLVEGYGEQNRYRMLETLREYALEHFPSAAELQRYQQQHAETFLQLAEEAEPNLHRAQQETWLNRLEAEHDNLRAALEHFLARGDSEKALRLSTLLLRFWEVRGYVSEGRNWLKVALADRGTAPEGVLARALNAAGWLAFRQGDLAYARQVHEEALWVFELAEEEIGVADTLCYLAGIDMDQGHYERVQKRLEDALALYRVSNHQLGIANAHNRLANLAWDQDRFADAIEYHRSNIAIYQSLDMPLSVAHSSLGMGDNERMLDNFDSACHYYQECIRLARSVGHRGLVAASLKSLGLLASKEGDYEQARLYGTEALSIFRELGDRIHTAFALSHLGNVAQHFGENSLALTHFGECLQIMYEVGYKWPTFYALEDIVELLTEVDQHREAAVRFLGAAETLRNETGLAVAPNFLEKYERMSATLRQRLGDMRFATLWQEGEITPLDQIVTEATQLSLI
jgi:predicted ATPase/DNA-binding SARP family transcriptional activator/tetratricopeptide (TPR) repeat protein